MSFILLGILNSQASAAGEPGDYELIETQVLDSTATSVSFTGLDSYTDYKHLQIRASLKSTQNGDLFINFNNDTSAKYAFQSLVGDEAVPSGDRDDDRPYLNIKQAVADDTNANEFAPFIMDIYDFLNTNKNTTTRSISGASVDNPNIRVTAGIWENTSALQEIDFEIEGGGLSFSVGCRLSIYGIRG